MHTVTVTIFILLLSLFTGLDGCLVRTYSDIRESSADGSVNFSCHQKHSHKHTDHVVKAHHHLGERFVADTDGQEKDVYRTGAVRQSHYFI